MRVLFQLNFILQVFWLLVICIGIFQPIIILYAAILIGLNHYVFSFILLIGDGRDSKLLKHFVFSTIYLGLFFLAVNGVVDMGNSTLSDFVVIVGCAIPALLAIHFWYITYVHFNPFRSLEHSVFDL